MAGSHWNEDGMTRRLGLYRGAKEKGEGTLQEYFAGIGQDFLELNIEGTDDVWTKIVAYIERNGVFGSISATEDIEESVGKDQSPYLTKEQELHLKKQKEQEEKDEAAKKAVAEEQRLKIEILKDQERKILDERSQPLR